MKSSYQDKNQNVGISKSQREAALLFASRAGWQGCPAEASAFPFVGRDFRLVRLGGICGCIGVD
jgi:hypothetical protein